MIVEIYATHEPIIIMNALELLYSTVSSMDFHRGVSVNGGQDIYCTSHLFLHFRDNTSSFLKLADSPFCSLVVISLCGRPFRLFRVVEQAKVFWRYRWWKRADLCKSHPGRGGTPFLNSGNARYQTMFPLVDWAVSGLELAIFAFIYTEGICTL